MTVTTAARCSCCGGELDAEWRQMLATMAELGVEPSGVQLCDDCETTPTSPIQPSERGENA